MDEHTKESKECEDDESIPREPVSREQLGELKGCVTCEAEFVA